MLLGSKITWVLTPQGVAQEKGARTDTAERGNALREREAHVLRPPKIEGNLPAHMLDFEMYVFFDAMHRFGCYAVVIC